MPDIKSGTIQITGLSELEKNLEQFPDRLAKNILSGAIRAGAVVIQNEARSRAPQAAEKHFRYYKGKLTGVVIPGNLKKNIKVRLAPRSSRERPIEYWVYVGKKAFYWRFMEFGTSKMSAKPFMRPAFETMKEKAIERMKEYLGARIDKEAAKRGGQI
jgi:HK97 gp10 family phage protein